jgi:Ion channel
VKLRDMDVVRRRVPRRIGPLMIRRRMTLTQAFAASVTVTGTALFTGAAAVTRTDPEQFPHFGIGLWWAATTVTTVGYGDVVPVSPAGRFVGAVLMFVGIASLALLTAIAASAIVVGEVRSGKREIRHEESQILSEIHELAYRIDRLERMLDERRASKAIPNTHRGDPASERR